MSGKLVLIVLLGVVAFHIYGFTFSFIFYQLYLLSGSPQHPTPFQWYPAVVGVSFLFGFLGAFPARFIAPDAGPNAAIAFVVAGVLSFLISTLSLGGGAGIVGQLSSSGFWGFVFGALVSFTVRWRVAT